MNTRLYNKPCKPSFLFHLNNPENSRCIDARLNSSIFMDLLSEFQQSLLCFFVAAQKHCKNKYDINHEDRACRHVRLTRFKSQRGFTVDDRRARRCRSQGSVWFCTRSFYHHSTVVTPPSSPPSRHGNLSVCVCVFRFERTKGGECGLEQILITTAQHTHTHTHTLSLQLCLLTAFSCPSAFNSLHSCDVVTGAF